MIELAVGLAIAAVLVVFLLKQPSRLDELRGEYLRRVHLPPAAARETLARKLESVSERFPGRSLEWYLDWLLKELRQDRR